MSTTQFGLLLIVLCTFIEGIGQVFLKKSSSSSRRFAWVAGGLGMLVAQGALYTYTLQWLPVGTAYPLGALSFVVVALLSRWVLGESITPKRWAGIALIMLGCALIAK